jgi:kynurenine formamidase
LLDYRSWAIANGVHYDAFTNHSVTLNQLLACAQAQNTQFEIGDILLIRFGWTENYLGRDDAERKALGGRKYRTFVGVENSLEMAKWHWGNGFAAVASDTIAYESWFPDIKSDLGYSLHEVFLSGWGMPIGELWNLEQLAAECKRVGKWSFFLTSQPLDIPGGVASPSNAMAIL